MAGCLRRTWTVSGDGPLTSPEASGRNGRETVRDARLRPRTGDTTMTTTDLLHAIDRHAERPGRPVTLAVLRAAFPTTDRAAFDAVLNAARKARLVGLEAGEFRHAPAAPGVVEAGITECGIHYTFARRIG